MATVTAEAGDRLKPCKRVVIKIGSALLVDAETGQLRQDWLKSLGEDIAALKDDGKDVILVSSGAIALGRGRLGLLGKVLTLPQKQACAAAGQSLLTRAYETCLQTRSILAAQALLTLEDTADRRRWLNARSTLNTLLDLGVVPIINENDTVATDEIRFGDNDRLAARTAQMLSADCLILLSDIDGLYDDDPRYNPDANHIASVPVVSSDIKAMAGGINKGAAVGSGGMVTKLVAAEIATQAGCQMIITDGQSDSPIKRLRNGARHTVFLAKENPKRARQQWISGSLKVQGALIVDTGAIRALEAGKSLLAAGVKTVEGHFLKGDAVRILDENGTEIARGLVAYGAKDAQTLKGQKSSDIITLLGYDNGAALIHRDNLVMVK